MIEWLRQWKVKWTSKTLWFNLVSAVLAGLELHFQFLRPILSEGLYGVTAFTIAMVNIVLRVMTVGPLVERVGNAAEDQPERT